MKTGGYARNVGSSDLYVRSLPSIESLGNLELIAAAGLIEYVDLPAMGVKMKRYAPRINNNWAWADKLNK
jgi:hypothetical protein